MLSRILLVVVLAASAATGCGDETDRKSVAAFASVDRITFVHVCNLLEAKGIDFAIGGSVVYGISVPQRQAEEATRVLRADAKKRGYWILFGEEEWPKVAEVTAKRVRRPIAELLAEPEFAEEKPLGRFLRSKEVSRLLRKYPFVESLGIRPREYLATKDKVEIGYEVEITLHAGAEDDSRGCRWGCQVLAEGREVASQGGSEWRPGGEE